MGRVTLKRLTWSNLRSFDGEHTISFDDRGLVLLRGLNHDTRGESAAGKSSLFMAIAYALDFAPYSAKDLKSWHNDDPMAVELELDTPSGPVVIHRGDKTWVKVGSNRPVTSAKSVKEEIDRALGVNKTLREALTFRRQRQPGMFLAKKDSEKKEFLVELLGLQWLEAEIEAQVKRVSAAEKQVGAVEPLLDKADADLAFAVTNQNYFEQIDLHWLEADLVCAEQQRTDATTVLDEVLSQRDAEQAETNALAQKAYAVIMMGVAPLEEEVRFLQAEEFVRPAYAEGARINRLKNEAESRLAAAKKVDRDRFLVWDTEVRSWQTDIRTIEREAAVVPALKAGIVKLEEKLKILKAEECSECRRPWDMARASIEKIQNQIDSDLEEILRQQARYPGLDELKKKVNEAEFTADPKIHRLQEMVKDLELQIAVEDSKSEQAVQVFKAEMGKKISDLKEQIATLKSQAMTARHEILSDFTEKWIKKSGEVNVLKAAADLATRQCDTLMSQIHVAAAQNAERKKAHEAQLAHLKRAQTTRNEAVEAVAKAKSDWSAERDYLDLFRGFLGQIFEEILREISAEANKVIGAIPNTAGVSLSFSISRETLDGKLRSEITPIVTFDGHEAPLESSASGGQFTSIEIAVDLAVSKVIAQRTGCDLAWLILDESFTGHTKVEKESCLETLKEFARDRLVLIVDHASEFKELFSKTITVESRGGHSKIKEIE